MLKIVHFLLLIIVLSDPIYDPTKTHLVDYNKGKNTYFFRGAYPGKHNNSGNFYDYEKMIDAINNASKKANLTDFPDTYYLVIISLFESGTEYYNLEVEFWKENPDKGKMIHWNIVGSDINATQLPKWKRDYYLDIPKEWEKIDIDCLSDRMKTLKGFLDTYEESPVIYYAHCLWGVDRTGEFCGSYLMNYHDYTFPQAMAYDIVVKKGHLLTSKPSKMFNWYCYYLDKHTKNNHKCDDWSTYHGPFP